LSLLRVGSFDVTGATLADVLRALRGKAGETKTLALERDGKQITVKAAVASLL
jgi:C-terminal processing protease CtpA/Prc